MFNKFKHSIVPQCVLCGEKYVLDDVITIAMNYIKYNQQEGGVLSG